MDSPSLPTAPIDVGNRRDVDRLKWRCRRGLLENDLIIERFFQRHGDTLTASQAQGLQALMELSDPDLLDLLLGRSEPEAALDSVDVRDVLQQMRNTSAARSEAHLSSPSSHPVKKELS